MIHARNRTSRQSCKILDYLKNSHNKQLNLLTFGNNMAIIWLKAIKYMAISHRLTGVSK